MSRQGVPVRSVLYVPGNKPRAIAKARTLPNDVVLFDLEDAVSPVDKKKARAHICQAISTRNFGQRQVAVRINDLHTVSGEDDLQAVLAVGPNIIVLPKVKTAKDVISLSMQIDRFEDQVAVCDLQIWVMLETAMSILNAKEIAELCVTGISRLSGFIVGTNDLVKETGAGRAQINSWLMNCVLVAKAYDLSIIDGVYNEFSDLDGLRKECQQGRDMGMDGKTLIHPGQIECCNEIFSPSPLEVEQARELVDLFENAAHKGASVLTLRGRMVERLHYEMAIETLRIASLNVDVKK